jgi:ADP-heptose:LPS heptosyltransferase
VLNLPRTYAFSHRLTDETDHNFGDGLVTHLSRSVGAIHESARGMELLQASGLVPDAPGRWSVEMQLRGLHAIAQEQDANDLLARAGVPSSVPYIVLAPGASKPNRAWPARSFRELCHLILQATDLHIVVTGTKSEFELAEVITAGSEGRAFNCAGAFNITELTAVLAHAKAFVGNDSGTGHIAGPLGIPVISLHTQAEGADPHHIRVTVLRPPSFLHPCRTHCEAAGPHCIAQITPTAVFNALMLAVNGDSAAGPKAVPKAVGTGV